MLDAERMPTRRLKPLHPAHNRELLQRLTAAMKAHGWIGKPLLGWEAADGDVRLFTGSYRYAAAKEAGVEPPVALVEIPDGILEADDEELRINGAQVLHDDEIESLLEDHDPDAVALFREDRREAEA